jgi:hypothetical protein
MIHQITVSRDIAELLVDLLETNWNTDDFPDPGGQGVQLAEDLRKLFGMVRQPRLASTQGSAELAHSRYTILDNGSVLVEKWDDIETNERIDNATLTNAPHAAY